MDIASYVDHPGGLLIYTSRPCPGCRRSTQEFSLCPECSGPTDQRIRIQTRRFSIIHAGDGRPAEVGAERELVATA